MYIFDGKVLDAYGVLGIQSGATDGEVKRAHRKLAAVYHPDRNSDREEWAKKKMQVVNEAYEEITKRRKGTYKSSNAKYQASDGSRPDLEKTVTNDKASSAGNSRSNRASREEQKDSWRSEFNGEKKGAGTSWRASGSSNYESNKTAYSSTSRGNDEESFSKYSHYITMTQILNSNWLHYNNLYEELLKKYQFMSSDEEKRKLSKLIDIFKEQMLIYSSFHTRFSRYTSLRDFDTLVVLEKEYNEFNCKATCVKELYKYMNEEMPFMILAVSSDFSGTHSSNYISKVETCIYMSVYFDNLIKEYIKTYVRYNTEEQFKYVYDRIVKEFNLFLSKNHYNINNLNSFIKSFKLKKFLKDCCSDFSFDETYVYRGKYTK